MIRPPPSSTLFPYPPPSRSDHEDRRPLVLTRPPAPHDERVVEPLERRPARDAGLEAVEEPRVRQREVPLAEDRKSTRLNSSHANISYAVFCLKKKNIS